VLDTGKPMLPLDWVLLTGLQVATGEVSYRP